MPTCSAVNVEESLWVATCYGIRQPLRGTIIHVMRHHLQDGGPILAVLHDCWVVHRILGLWDVVINISNLNVDLNTTL